MIGKDLPWQALINENTRGTAVNGNKDVRYLDI